MKHLCGILLAAAAVALSGCETESSDQIAISISPNNVTMKKGESREFTASGWQDYTWSLNGTNKAPVGVLSTTKGNSTVYTAIKGPSETNGILSDILVLTVNIPADDVSATNTVPGGGGNVTAQSLITITYTP